MHRNHVFCTIVIFKCQLILSQYCISGHLLTFGCPVNQPFPHNQAHSSQILITRLFFDAYARQSSTLFLLIWLISCRWHCLPLIDSMCLIPSNCTSPLFPTLGFCSASLVTLLPAAAWHYLFWHFECLCLPTCGPKCCLIWPCVWVMWKPTCWFSDLLPDIELNCVCILNNATPHLFPSPNRLLYFLPLPDPQ